MAYKYQKEYSLRSITIKVPKDCGTGLSFWINQQVASVIDNIPTRWDEGTTSHYRFPNKKLSDSINETLKIETNGVWVKEECGHGEWQQKETGYLTLTYSFSDVFILSDLDFHQIGRSYKEQASANKFCKDYADIIANALSASGIHTTVYVDVVKHYYKPSHTEEYCSYCSSNRTHKAHTRTVDKKRLNGSWWCPLSGYCAVNIPPEEISQAA